MPHALWGDARRYFRRSGGGGEPPFAGNCRLMFYLLGEMTMNEIFADSFMSLARHIHTAFNTSHDVDFVHDDKRGRMHQIIPALQNAVEHQGPGKAKTTLKDLIVENWESAGAEIQQHAGALKQQGLVVAFNHIRPDQKGRLANLFADDGIGFLRYLGNWKFHRLLTDARRAPDDPHQIAIDEAKRLGVIRPIYNVFNPGEDPTLPDGDTGHAISAMTPRNGLCCSASGCVDGDTDDWCELQNPDLPYDPVNNRCSASSDPCS